MEILQNTGKNMNIILDTETYLNPSYKNPEQKLFNRSQGKPTMPYLPYLKGGTNGCLCTLDFTTTAKCSDQVKQQIHLSDKTFQWLPKPMPAVHLCCLPKLLQWPCCHYCKKKKKDITIIISTMTIMCFHI